MSIKSSIIAVLGWLAGKAAPTPIEPELKGSPWVDPKAMADKVTALYEAAVEQAETALGVLYQQHDSHLQSIASLHVQVNDHELHIKRLQSVKNQVSDALYSKEAPNENAASTPVEPPPSLG
jgi:NH3-dependent NAD+ synthetase